MLIEPKSATTTNNDSNKVVVSGQTETPEVAEKKKRGRKPTTNNYFDEREETAVRSFLVAETQEEKNKIYNEFMEFVDTVFDDEGNFRDDTIYYVRNFIDSIDIFKVVDSFIRSKGRIRDGRRYQKLVQQEFKVGSFDNLLNDIKARYLESMDYFIVGKDWDITSNTYGKSINNPDLLELTISKIKRVAETAIRNSVEYYLPKRKIQNSIELTADQEIKIGLHSAPQMAQQHGGLHPNAQYQALVTAGTVDADTLYFTIL